MRAADGPGHYPTASTQPVDLDLIELLVERAYEAIAFAVESQEWPDWVDLGEPLADALRELHRRLRDAA